MMSEGDHVTVAALGDVVPGVVVARVPRGKNPEPIFETLSSYRQKVLRMGGDAFHPKDEETYLVEVAPKPTSRKNVVHWVTSRQCVRR